jgi:hypothetical protein
MARGRECGNLPGLPCVKLPSLHSELRTPISNLKVAKKRSKVANSAHVRAVAILELSVICPLIWNRIVNRIADARRAHRRTIRG